MLPLCDVSPNKRLTGSTWNRVQYDVKSRFEDSELATPRLLLFCFVLIFFTISPVGALNQ